ncbi:hypothetical protein DVH24_011103 [Malus domestica]|uniref:Uncharacterized protein n=1 Tax=Malus domestica TaxID=3750 RepID=A0A498JSK3_MALDO|nr:hypothetical protein DVH24_006014 [Malus domestica]RXH86802.1 hypothetical protein DVH24_022075 [Malus domestica]RXH93344.1 hypothetical protein DVH24_013920 [Malus domestica]RXH96137.1 hypothetical protein DVH24_008637 [Malus domestica]RXH98778.1 hypothetical protein DVH24_011103 [Malus domestica]
MVQIIISLLLNAESICYFMQNQFVTQCKIIYKIFDLGQGHFSNHTGLYSDSAELVNSFMELYSDSRQF